MTACSHRWGNDTGIGLVEDRQAATAASEARWQVTLSDSDESAQLLDDLTWLLAFTAGALSECLNQLERSPR